MHVCVFKVVVSVKQNKVLGLKVRQCWKWKIEVAARQKEPLTVVVDGLRHHRAQLEDVPCGQGEGGLEAEPH